MNLFLLAYLAAVAGITIASPVLPRDVDSTTSSPRVTIKQGTLVGTHLNSFDQDIFLDIPYAQPPTGQLRFRAPEPVNTSWIGDRPAVKYGNSCYHWSKAYQHGLTYSEDCLNLNIVRPSGYAGEKLPVAFWVYGGSFQSGSANLDSLNLSYPVKQSVLGGTPVLAVSVNYRMGPLGFFASSEMEKAKEMNNGLKDLVLAVRWVQENIESFGGDPAKITLWGQSAGAEAVSNLLTAYGGQLNGLFAQVVLESGSSVRLPHNYLPIETWQPQFKSILENTNCDDATDPVDCLRSLTIEKIVDVFDTSNEIVKIPYYPAVDGDFIPDWPKNLLSQGRFVKVPMLIGANMDEGTSFGPGHINTTEQLTAWLQKSYPAMENSTIDRLLELYPNDPSLGSPFGTGDLYSTEYGLQYKRGNALAGDIAMAGPRRLMAETWSNSGQTVYSYNWNQSDYKNPPYMGANHIQELIYVFDNPSDDFPESHASTIGPDPSGKKTLLAHQISRFVMSFIATGDPNNAKLDNKVDKWPTYNTSDPKNYYFNKEDTHIEADDWRKEAINFTNYEVGHQLYNYIITGILYVDTQVRNPSRQQPKLMHKQSILQVMIIVLIGWVLAREGLITESKQKWLARLNMSFFTPCLLFTRMAPATTPKILIESWPVPVLYCAFSLISYVVAHVAARLWRLSSYDRRFLIASTVFSNTNSMPIAVMTGIVSSHAVQYLIWNADDNIEDILSRSISYIVLYGLFGNIFRWSYGYSLLTEREESNTLKKPDLETRIYTSDELPKSRTSVVHTVNSVTANTPLLHTHRIHYSRMDIQHQLFEFTNMVYQGITRPLAAALLAVMVAFVPDLQHILFAKDSFIHGGLIAGLESCGSASVPIVLICLGAQIQTSTIAAEDDGQQTKSVVFLAVLCRMIISPFLAISMLSVIYYYCRDKISLTGDPVFFIVLGLVAAMPTAISLTQIVQSGRAEKLLLRTLFWGYGVLCLPLCVATVLVLLVILNALR